MFVIKIRPAIAVFWNVSTIKSAEAPSANFLKPLQTIDIRRSIFTNEFVDKKDFPVHTAKLRLAITDEEGFKKRIHSLYVKSGHQSIFTSDILQLIHLAVSDEDFDLVKNILLGCLRDEIRSANLYKPLSYFYTQCLYSSKEFHARAVWDDEHAQKSGLLQAHNLRNKYLLILYRKECYDEVVGCYESFEDPTLIEATIAIAALAKKGTPEAFTTATRIMRKPPLTKMKSSAVRSTVLYAYLAVKLGHYGPAFDFLTDQQRGCRPTNFTTNLKVLILTEVGRLKDAMQVIKSEILRGGRKESGLKNDDDSPEPGGAVVYLEVVRKLTDAVRGSKDPDLSQELTALFKDLDGAANLEERPMEEMIFKPIYRKGRSNPAKEDDAPRRRRKTYRERNL